MDTFLSLLAGSELTLILATLVGLALTALAIARDVDRWRVTGRVAR